MGRIFPNVMATESKGFVIILSTHPVTIIPVTFVPYMVWQIRRPVRRRTLPNTLMHIRVSIEMNRFRREFGPQVLHPTGLNHERISIICHHMPVQSEAKLANVVGALDLLCFSLRTGERHSQKRRKNPNDRDHDQKFYQAESGNFRAHVIFDRSATPSSRGRALT